MARRDPKSPLAVAVGDRLRQVRRFRGASQTELARAMRVSQGSISNYERGLREVRAVEFLRALDYLHCSPEEFFIELDAFIVPLGRDQKRIESLRDEERSTPTR